MSDLIDRRAAIDALGERPMVWVGSDYELGARNQYDADVLALETVPSAQPDLPIKEKCAFCPHCNNCDVNDDLSIQPCVDTISRQMAIDALENIDCSDGIGISALKCDVVEDAINAINALPSAQPETHDKHTETHACDLIDRRAAILAIKTRQWLTEGAKEALVDQLERLPSAQSERQKGEWIDYTEDGYVECPYCHSATNCDGNKDELHFCFSCGADMREDEHR